MVRCCCIQSCGIVEQTVPGDRPAAVVTTCKNASRTAGSIVVIENSIIGYSDAVIAG